MHSLTICFGPAATIWTLLYKTEEKASEFYNAYVSQAVERSTGIMIGTDDFGQAFALPFEQINGVLLDDMDQSQMAYIERGLHQARSQAKAQSRAMGDPTLKAAMLSQGPAVFSGGVPNGRMS